MLQFFHICPRVHGGHGDSFLACGHLGLSHCLTSWRTGGGDQGQLRTTGILGVNKMNIPIRSIFNASVSYLKRKVRKIMKKITLEIETNRPKRIWIHKKYPEELSHDGNENVF